MVAVASGLGEAEVATDSQEEARGTERTAWVEEVATARVAVETVAVARAAWGTAAAATRGLAVELGGGMAVGGQAVLKAAVGAEATAGLVEG
jgi:hypothetical protein